MFSHVLLIGLGLLLVIFGFWGSSKLHKPYDTLAAWCAPVGLLVTLTGVVLLIIPDFFS